MRRALASFLLLVFSFTLIAPAVFADAASNLPECCRRGGKHHCAMRLDNAPSAQDVAFGSTQPQCPSYPGVLTTPPGGYVAILNKSGTIFGTVVSHPAIQVQTETGYRISPGRSAQKRGPPVLS
jgi:hypothetical protein